MSLLIKECLTSIPLVQMWAWNPGYSHPKARDFSWLTGYFFLPKLIKIQTPICLTRGVWNPHLGKVKLIGKEKKSQIQATEQFELVSSLVTLICCGFIFLKCFSQHKLGGKIHWNHQTLGFPTFCTEQRVCTLCAKQRLMEKSSW